MEKLESVFIPVCATIVLVLINDLAKNLYVILNNLFDQRLGLLFFYGTTATVAIATSTTKREDAHCSKVRAYANAKPM
jgi:hypothetical protein